MKFPHVRLFMRNLMVEGAGCSGVIAATAYEYGLIPLEAVGRVESAFSDSSCSCMASSRQVLRENFACSAKREHLEKNLEDIWSTIDERARICFPSEKDNPMHNCEKSAPILFDILLQELSRY
ncbi:MAG: hypothetical protein K2Z81_14585 [Cyanobacteria bacterium]|nr:hypothetical protein [Cyanobacteriota bacterium]